MALRRLNTFLFIQLLRLIFLGSILNAQLPEKKVTIDVHNKSLRSIFKEISLQTGYLFTYNSNIIDEKELKTVHIQDFFVQRALDSILNYPELSYAFIDKNIVIYKKNREIQVSEDRKKRSSTIITGRILDIENNMPLEFATISLNNTNRGTFSNLQGEFSFTIPANIENPILVISMMGYDNQHYAINFEDPQDLLIHMTPRIISLQEIIIRYNNPEVILTETIKRIPENYISQTFFMEAYFREFTLKNNEIMTFSEAAIEIAKPSYTNYTGNEKIQIIKGRKISNITKEDSILLKIESGIHSTFLLDIISNPIDILQSDYRDYYDVQFLDIISFKDNLAYVINFKQKANFKDILFQGQLYIDMDDMTILAADFEIDPSLIGKESSMFFIKRSRNIKARPLFAKYHVEYQMSEGRYHLNMVHGEVGFKFRKRRNWFSSTFKIIIELAVTNIDLEKDPAITRSEQVKQGTILSDENFPADPLFWNEYNIIVPERELEDAIKRMGENWKGME